MAAKPNNGDGTINGGDSQGSGGNALGGYRDLDKGEKAALLHERELVNYDERGNSAGQPAAVTAPFAEGGIGLSGGAGNG